MRGILKSQLQAYSGKEVALLFSGGLDSLSLLLSCMDVGIKPHLYSFKLEGVESDDIKASRKIANIYGLAYTEVVIPKCNLLKDVKYIIGKYGVKKKTQVQCIHPFIYVVKEVKEDIVLSGLCADDVYGTSRKMQEVGRKDDEAFYKVRLEKHNDIEASSYKYIKDVFEEVGKSFVAPYKDNAILVNYLLSKGFDELHKPKLKGLTYGCYKAEIDAYKLYRRNSGLQVNSGIREWHDELLNMPINSKGYKSVVGIYNTIYKSIRG